MCTICWGWWLSIPKQKLATPDHQSVRLPGYNARTSECMWWIHCYRRLTRIVAKTFEDATKTYQVEWTTVSCITNLDTLLRLVIFGTLRSPLTPALSNQETAWVIEPAWMEIKQFLWPPLWYSGLGSWLQIQRSRVQFSALPNFLERDPFSLVSTI
jgi:hypothetical protein